MQVLAQGIGTNFFKEVVMEFLNLLELALKEYEVVGYRTAYELSASSIF